MYRNERDVSGHNEFEQDGDSNVRRKAGRPGRYADILTDFDFVCGPDYGDDQFGDNRRDNPIHN